MNGNRIWMLGVAVAAVVVIAFGWLFAISPTLAQADLATSQAQSADAQNTAQQIALVRLKSQYDKLPKLKADLANLRTTVPETANLDDFLDQLQQLAQSTGVTITGFTAAEASLFGGADAAAPTPTASETPKPADAAGSANASATTSSSGVKDKLFSIPVTIAVKGSPEQVLAFTDASQKGARLFLVTGDGFTGSRDNPSDDGGTLTGFVFVVRDAPAAVVPAK
jgi:Tfp pilus assembly protein PilO